MGLFDGKVVLVTGAGSGIGREEALYFAKEGASVVVNDLGGTRTGEGRGEAAADAVAAEIKQLGGKAVANYDSISHLDGAESCVWGALGRFGRVDVLVNNAGILRDRSLLNLSEADWDTVIDVHLKGTFLCTRAFARALKQQGTGGAVINTTSVSGLMGNYGQTNYGAAKAGVYAMTRTWSIELAKLGVRVNAIAPVALTRMTDDIERLKDMGIESMTPAHVAPVVAWLASDLAQDITGRIFGVHGLRVFEYRMSRSDGAPGPTEGDAWTPESLQRSIRRIELND